MKKFTRNFLYNLILLIFVSTVYGDILPEGILQSGVYYSSGNISGEGCTVPAGAHVIFLVGGDINISDTFNAELNSEFKTIAGDYSTLQDLYPDLDLDGDGLPDWIEVRDGLNTLNIDTDNDGLEDGIEVSIGSDPAVANIVVKEDESTDYDTIQDAINATIDDPNDIDFVDGVTNIVYVNEGRYYENLIDFDGRAITVKSVNGPENCIVDGSGSNTVFVFNSEETDSSRLSGLTITNGLALVGHTAGGLLIKDGSSPEISGCIIKANVGVNSSAGGGIYCGAQSSPNINNCIIVENIADEKGGGIYCKESSPNIINCTISANTIDGNIRGGGIFCKVSSPDIKNSIIWGNEGDDIYADSSAFTVLNSDIEGGTDQPWAWFDSATCIDEDPEFVSLANNDYHLQIGSPCIGAGTSDGAPSEDIDGESRPLGQFIDIGADEYNIDSGLIAYWKFDETSGSTAADSAGNYDCELSKTDPPTDNAISWVADDCVIDGCVKYGPLNVEPPVTGQTITTSEYSDFQSDIITYATWYKSIPGKINYPIKWKRNGEGSWHLKVDGVNKRFNVNDYQNKIVYECDKTPPDGEWSHIAVIIDNTKTDVDNGIYGQISFYINGNHCRTIEMTNPISLDGMYVANGIFGDNYDFSLDDTRLYNRSLSPDEIKLLYYMRYDNIDPNNPETLNPVAHYRFDNSDATNIYDSVDPSNDGVVLDSATKSVDALDGQSLNMQYATSKVQLGDGDAPVNNVVDPDYEWSVSFWLKWNGQQDYYNNDGSIWYTIFEERVYGSGWKIAIKDGRIGFISFDANWKSVATVDKYLIIDPANNGNLKIWQNIVLVGEKDQDDFGVIKDKVNLDSIKIYIDGKLHETKNNGSPGDTWALPNDSVYIGDKYAVARSDVGLIDDLKFFNYALNETDVERLNDESPRIECDFKNKYFIDHDEANPTEVTLTTGAPDTTIYYTVEVNADPDDPLDPDIIECPPVIENPAKVTIGGIIDGYKVIGGDTVNVWARTYSCRNKTWGMLHEWSFIKSDVDHSIKINDYTTDYAAEALTTYNPNMFGSVMQGRIGKETKYDMMGEGFWNPATKGVVEGNGKGVDIFKNAGINVIRYPGPATYKYRWKQTVGPLNQRGPDGWTYDAYAFGIDEAIKVRDASEAEMIFTLSYFEYDPMNFENYPDNPYINRMTKEEGISSVTDLVSYLNKPYEPDDPSNVNVEEDALFNGKSWEDYDPYEADTIVENWDAFRVLNYMKINGVVYNDVPENVKNGYGVKYFELGNERYFKSRWPIEYQEDSLPEGVEEPALEYIDRYKAYRKAMKEVDDSIFLGATIVGKAGIDSNNSVPGEQFLWDYYVLDSEYWAEGEEPDFLVPHIYSSFTELENISMMDSEFWRTLFAPKSDIENRFEYLHSTTLFNQRGDIPLAITEYGTNCGGSLLQIEYHQMHCFAISIYIAEMIKTFMRSDVKIDIAVLHHALLNTLLDIPNKQTTYTDDAYNAVASGEYVPQPSYYLFKLFKEHFAEKLIDAEVVSEVYMPTDQFGMFPSQGYHDYDIMGQVPFLSVNSSIDDANIYIMVINKNIFENIKADIDMSEVAGDITAGVTIYTFTSENLNDHDLEYKKWGYPPHRDYFKIDESSGTITDNTFSYTFPKHSITVVEIPRQ